ncbi:hypothetical protein NA57DRAFT_57631 [Rhizodiscina lignyota]|uniref:Uncharacterized protein n=1 Tax=Rhizodiscina lignyota TaxID=1504668 RepID=A0A9P4IEF3_9PEZI|nr:hypothetical protein NA57DRAFT_57631 [Rhizodiscina lignyota]
MSEQNTSAVGAESAQPWDETRIRASLARIEQLQNQLDALRFVIPTITASAVNQGTSRTTYFKQFSVTAIGGSEQLEKFKRDWRDKSTQEIFDKAKTRREEDSNLSMAVGVPKYGWIEQDEGGSALSSTEVEDMKKTVEMWKEKHPEVKVNLEDEDSKAIVQYTAGPYRLHFTVARVVEDNRKQVYQVSCSGAKPVFAAMERCIASRPRTDRLYDTLDMLSAYSNLPTAQCATCKRLLDRQATIPAARRRKQSASPPAENGTDVEWDALHESCLSR